MVDGNISKFISIDDFYLMIDAISILSNFKNEAPELVAFLNKQAHAESMANLSKTFLLITNDEKKVQGYFSISTSEVARKVIKAPHGTTYANVPSALIKTMAMKISDEFYLLKTLFMRC